MHNAQPREKTVKTILFDIFIFIAMIAIDQIVKNWIESNIALRSVVAFIPGIIDITFVKNSGAAFGMLSSYSWILLVVRIFMSGVVSFVLIKYYKKMHPLFKLSLCLILAGAIGNLIDQIWFGYVRDMFEFHFVEFAVFNVADIWITFGGAFLFIYYLFIDRRRKEKIGKNNSK